jgi:hypothetical protein
MRALAESAGAEAMSRFYEVEVPALAARALEATGPIADVLIIDEGQDVLSAPFADVLGAAVVGGVHDGTWRLFLDPRQDIFRNLHVDALGRFRAARPAELRLSVNCRNTTQIADVTALLSGIRSDDILGVDGPKPQIDWYDEDERQGELLAGHIRRLLDEGMAPHRIALLSRYKRENSRGMQNLGPIAAEISDVSTGGWRKGAIMFSTVTGFKGLEADAVIMMDNSHLRGGGAKDEELNAASYYVGLSRAKSILVVLLHERNRAEFERLAQTS